MTYLELAKLIMMSMNDEQRGMDVTIQNADREFVRVEALTFTDDEPDILDANHPYLEVP